jgi:hydrogenase maturation factor
MNLLYGQIVEIASEDGMRVGKIGVSGAFRTVSLELLGAAQIGDRVLVCDGIAISQDDMAESLLLSEQLLPRAALQPSCTPTLLSPDSRLERSAQ